MTNIKKYGLVAALVLPSLFTVTSKSHAAKAVKNSERAKAVNVRSEAKESNNIIGLIDNDKSYEILDTQSNWLKIKFNDKEAYVGRYWFDIVEEATVKSPANFRKNDALNSEVFQILRKDDVVEVKSLANNGFVKIYFEGKEGYVHESLLNLSEDFINANYKQEPVHEQNTSYQESTSNQATNNYYYESTQQTYYEPSQSYFNSSSYTGNSSSAKEIIAQRESGGSYGARNGQYIGRYQLSSSYLNGDYSAENQERVADQYVSQRYGSWENALEFWNNNGWY